MKCTSILAIYFLFWVFSAFVVMPFHVRTADETGDSLLKGQAESAPVGLRPKRIILQTTLVSAALFGLYYANYVNGWVTSEMFQPSRP